MLDKLIKVEEKFEDINEKLCQSDVVADMAQYKKLMQELKVLTPIVEKFRQLKTAQATLNEAKEMLDAGGLEKDFREMVQEEYEQAVEDVSVFQEELKVLLLPRDPNDDKNV
ncbi:MAG: PCRF domain-containing protein, partial [Acutalibacteraceae bacterium]|nr:PCRF domain-containing protein [Acutalibacteraceae bacterium]